MLDLTTAALAVAYDGADELAHELLDEAEGRVERLGGHTLRAYAAYVRGEALAHVGDPRAPGHLERPFELSTASGASFVGAVATVTLASSAARSGDLARACALYPEVIRYWERTGSWTQQWTTLRNVAELLAACRRDADAALLLAAADADPGAPTVVGADAARLAACRQGSIRRLGESEAERLREAGAGMPRAAVVQRALEAADDATAVG